MKRYIAPLLLTLLAPLPAFSDTADELHLKTAFSLAHNRMWGQAIDEAKAGHSAVLAKYFAWLYLKDPSSDATFSEITSFIDDNPDWPDKAALLKHAEVALLASNASDATVNAWLDKHPPQTNMAKRMGARNREELNSLIRDAWVRDDYDKETEKKLLARYHGVLRAQDHISRIDRLLWEGKEEQAKRILKFVPYDHQRLFQARMYLADDKSQAPMEVANVAPALKGDPGLLYERLRWRLRGGDKDGVRELLLTSPEEVPYAEKWWPIRDRQIREALGEGDVKLAKKLLTRHAQKEGSLAYKEVKWLEGWIALEFSGDAGKAYGIFSKLFHDTETPAGRSRVAYWAGRAATAAHKGDASHWYEDAARYPTTFYGQLASAETDSDATIRIRSEEEPSSSEKEHFKKRELVQLVRVLGTAHETDAAGRFLLYLLDDAESPAEAILAMRLGTEIGRIDFSVRAAKKALASNIVSVRSGWPVVKFNAAHGIETPLLLALSRQESEFNAEAVSPSGAVGLMQLLPSTAKELARKNDMRYSFDRLYEPSYNMTLGSLYLQKMLAKFDGSYVLAVASYNAGPGRVNQWLSAYGAPGNKVHETVDWIERIPTTETRNYVQHVIGNMQVYRYVLAGHETPLTIDEDLVR